MRRLVAPLILIVSLGLSACDDDESTGDPAGVLSSEQLSDALLADGTTVGGGVTGPEDLPGLADDRAADPTSCQPLSALIDVEPEPVHSARVQSQVPQLGPWVDVQLLSYGGDDAEKVFDLVAGAVDDCSGGFAEDRIRDVTVDKVTRESAPELGDEAVAYATTTTEVEQPEGSEMVEHMVLVRDGQQLLSFRGTSFGDAAEAIALLDAVVQAQWARYAARDTTAG